MYRECLSYFLKFMILNWSNLHTFQWVFRTHFIFQELISVIAIISFHEPDKRYIEKKDISNPGKSWENISLNIISLKLFLNQQTANCAYKLFDWQCPLWKLSAIFTSLLCQRAKAIVKRSQAFKPMLSYFILHPLLFPPGPKFSSGQVSCHSTLSF